MHDVDDYPIFSRATRPINFRRTTEIHFTLRQLPRVAPAASFRRVLRSTTEKRITMAAPDLTARFAGRYMWPMKLTSDIVRPVFQ